MKHARPQKALVAQGSTEVSVRHAQHDLPRSMRPSAAREDPHRRCCWYCVLIYFLFPIYWAIIASTKTPSPDDRQQRSCGSPCRSDRAARRHRHQLFASCLAGPVANFWRWVLNSLIYSGVSALVGTHRVRDGRLRHRKIQLHAARTLAIGIIMACMLMPAALLTIPQYSIFHALHLTNTMLSIIIPCCVSPFGFFLGRVYAQTSVPNELLEAARIDGASEARIFFTIVLRLLAPAMVTIFLFLFVATWNNFLLPLMMVSSDTLKPVTLGLYGMVSLATFTDRGALMMGALLGVLPVIVLFLGLQRYWQAGLAAGAVKG